MFVYSFVSLLSDLGNTIVSNFEFEIIGLYKRNNR